VPKNVTDFDLNTIKLKTTLVPPLLSSDRIPAMEKTMSRWLCLQLVVLLSVTACSKSRSAHHSDPAPAPSASAVGPDAENAPLDNADDQQPPPPVPVSTHHEVIDEEPQDVDPRSKPTKWIPPANVETGVIAGDEAHRDNGKVISENKPKENRGQECGVPYRRNEADWFPGLPFASAKTPHLTRGVDVLKESAEATQKDPSLGLQYTDAAKDDLMKAAVARDDAKDKRAQRANHELALRIVDVDLNVDQKNSSRAELSFGYDVGQGRYVQVVLEGEAQQDGRFQLQQTHSEVSGEFRAVVRCVDADGGCENSLITIQLMSVKHPGAIAREVEVVHRLGDAHLTIADQDMTGAGITNSSHKRLAAFFANTVNNSCLVELALVRAGQIKMQSCTVERLQKECGQEDSGPRFPSARTFTLQTWAVAYGRSGFRFDAEDGQSTHVVIAGPLVISRQRPMAAERLHTEGMTGVARADLIANDGGGNLNLQLIFAGKPKSHTRLNITSLFAKVSAK
jgi:hypothetical protein